MKALNSTLLEAPKMYQTENDISLKRRSELNALMNQRLAPAVDLQMQMKYEHPQQRRRPDLANLTRKK